MRYLSFVLVAAAAGAFSGSRAAALPMPVSAAKNAAPAPQFRDAARAVDAVSSEKTSREYSRKGGFAAARRISVAAQESAPLLHSEVRPRTSRSVIRFTSNVARATMPQNFRRVAARRAPQRLAALPNSQKIAASPLPKNDVSASREYSQDTSGAKKTVGGASGTASATVVAMSKAPDAKKFSAAADFAKAAKSAPRSTPSTLPAKAPAMAKAPLPRRATPVVPASRQMDRDRILLAQLERELRRTQSGLDRADADLSATERQLAAFSSTLQKAMSEAGVDARGLHPFVRVAQKYAGTPYVWGGESRNGFDCSGFIIVVMRELGYKTLPHSAAEQFNYGMPVAQALLKPGDLVFFANTYKPGISHVGIYLGKRRFIHAAGTGLGTIVSSLDAAKFQAKYAGARRLVRAH